MAPPSLPSAEERPSQAAPADEELVAGMARGSPRAIRELYRRLSSVVYSLILRIARSEEDAEEVLVDSFHQAWAQAARYDPARATVTGWLLNIARSRAIDRRRSRRRWQEGTRSLAEAVGSFPSHPPANPEREAIRNQEGDRLRRAIDDLPPDQKRALELAYFSGMSHSEIAEHLGQPLGTVKTRLRLAMEKIRNALAGVEETKR